MFAALNAALAVMKAPLANDAVVFWDSYDALAVMNAELAKDAPELAVAYALLT